MRVVLDTNVLVSAFIRTRGRVTSLWQAARERRYRLVLSPVIISEVAETLRKDFHWEERRLVNRSKLMARTAEMVVPRLVIDVVQDDPDDNRILECAVEGKADLIVSGDRVLLRLKSYQSIPIVRPIDFLRILGFI